MLYKQRTNLHETKSINKEVYEEIHAGIDSNYNMNDLKLKNYKYLD